MKNKIKTQCYALAYYMQSSELWSVLAWNILDTAGNELIYI
jgi:hypothetical protein